MTDPSKDVDMSEEVKGLSVNVQKLRFMQKATEEKDRKELERRQLKALEKARWCVPGMEEEAKQTADVISDVEKAPAIRPVMGYVCFFKFFQKQFKKVKTFKFPMSF